MRLSKYFIPTLKEEPTEAEIPSHKLMMRAGMLRKLSSGIYTYLPLAYRVIHKIETIIREELNKVGCQELLLPILHPKELWTETGRWDVYGPELMRLTDRHNKEFALGPTHEEVITALAKYEIKSYKQLPINLYQIQTKFRDEIRPRFGVMRAREFIMKDAYSFHKDRESLKQEYKKMHNAYTQIFKRCGLKFTAVEAAVGTIGGSNSHEFMVLAETGESEVLHCECGYSSTRENTRIAKLDDNRNEQMLEIKKVHTPGKKSVTEVSEFLNVEPSRLIKTIIYRADDNFVAILIRGDREINEVKVANFLKATTLYLASDDEINNVLELPNGFVGPVNIEKSKVKSQKLKVGCKMKIYADNNLKLMRNMVTGANEKDYHFLNVNIERPARRSDKIGMERGDVKVDQYGDFIMANAGDGCPKCGKPLYSYRGIEVGQIFELGDKYSKSMNATFQDENGESKYYLMGCYGIGVTRTIAAAIEQNYDEKGIIWPLQIAPFQVEILQLAEDEDLIQFSENLYQMLLDANIEVLYDDRKERAGIKFNDADLIGIPIQIIIGMRSFKNEQVEIKIRKTGQRLVCGLLDILGKIKELLKRDDL